MKSTILIRRIVTLAPLNKKNDLRYTREISLTTKLFWLRIQEFLYLTGLAGSLRSQYRCARPVK